jgi:hypothetical protein
MMMLGVELLLRLLVHKDSIVQLEQKVPSNILALKVPMHQIVPTQVYKIRMAVQLVLQLSIVLNSA